MGIRATAATASRLFTQARRRVLPQKVKNRASQASHIKCLLPGRNRIQPSRLTRHNRSWRHPGQRSSSITLLLRKRFAAWAAEASVLAAAPGQAHSTELTGAPLVTVDFPPFLDPEGTGPGSWVCFTGSPAAAPPSGAAGGAWAILKTSAAISSREE
jgi:hypothetical protein